MTDIKTIKKLVNFCRKHGINKFKDGEFEIELGNKPNSSTIQRGMDTNTSQGVPGFQAWDSLSEEQKLLWSATPLDAEKS